MSGIYIPERDSSGNIINVVAPFTAKTTKDGKLFRRLHGVTVELVAAGDTVVEFNVPYIKCKITEVQVAWAPEGVTVDLQVLDTPTGTISTIPNYMLNQFGFNVPIQKDFHKDASTYDADLIQNMKIKLTLHNPSTAKTIGVGFVLHEVI